MKILRIISSMNPKLGGPSQGIRNSIPEMKKMGVQNEVVCFDNEDEEFIKQDKFVVHALGASKGGWFYNPALPIWLEKNFSNYTIIIVHGLWLYHSYATIKEIFRHKNHAAIPKVFLMPHGMLDPWFQRDKSRQLKALRNEIYWRLIEKKVVNSADGLLFTCEQELLLARETFKGYAPKTEINVGYGIQSPPAFAAEMEALFKEKCLSLPDKQPYLLFLSRIHAKKGVDLLINAYLQLEKDQIELPDLVIAGPLEGEFALNIQKEAKASTHIHFTGMLQGNEKWGAFYGCEAFILPSHQENFGISVAEALACSKPVLISNQVNIFKEIEKGNGGIIADDTLEGTICLIRSWIVLNNVEKNTMRSNSHNVYERNFTINAAAKKFLQGITA